MAARHATRTLLQIELVTTGGPEACRSIIRWFEGTLGWQLSEEVMVVAGAGLGDKGLLTGDVTRGAVADGNGAVVGVRSFDSVSRLRNFVGKPHLLRLLSVDVAADKTCEDDDSDEVDEHSEDVVEDSEEEDEDSLEEDGGIRVFMFLCCCI